MGPASPPTRVPDAQAAGRGFAVLLLSVLFLSSGWPLTKLAIDQGASPLWFAEGRAVLSGLVAAVVLIARRRLRIPPRSDWPVVIAVGAFQLGGFFAFAHLALAWVAAGRTAVLSNTTTIFVVPLSLLVLHEPIPPRRWAATVIGLAGVAVLVGPWAVDWHSRPALIGNAFLLAAALSWTIAILVLRRAPPRSPMLDLLPWCFLVACLVLLPLLLWEAPGGGIGARLGAWGSLGYVGLIAGPLGTWGVIEATVILPAVVASVGFLATPAFGVLLSNWILGEPITQDLVLGTALILVGVGLAAWPKGRRR
ncbi:MAG: DMT family transporter [Rhodospirillales bacterium]|nr:DMT family transporter [Rhodospirillales bacterium]